MNDTLARLYEAHVAHELAAWQGPELARTLEERVNALFRWFAEVELDQVATRAQILGVIERYVIELRVSGGITELSGEMSRHVFTSRATTDTRLDQILTPEMYDEFADKVLALDRVRRELIAWIAQSETVRTISARLIARGVLDVLTLAVPRLGRLTPSGVSAIATEIGRRILPGLERIATEAIARHRERVARDSEKDLLELFDAERLRSVADELWDRVAAMPLSEVFAYLGEQDIEDFVVLVYEFWLRYRKTTFFRRISSELVDYFFDKYGQTTLLALIDDLGVTESMVRSEVLTLLSPVLESAARSGTLERAIRGRLERFYNSPAAAAALDREQ
jgi:hypothetical protein